MKAIILFLVSSFLIDSSIHAGTIRKLNAKKRLVLMAADKGDTWKRGDKVCFFSGAQKMACGRVLKAQGRKVFVRVKKRFGKLKPGFKTSAITTETTVVTTEDSGEPKLPYSIAIRGLARPFLIAQTQATYNLLSYNGANAQQGESLWQSEGAYADGANSTILASFGAEVEYLPFNLRGGFHYKSYSTFISDSDYDRPGSNLFAQTTIDASAIGFYLDYFYNVFAGLNVGAGIDIDMTDLTLSSIRKDDFGNEEELTLYSSTGSAMILSLRAPIRYDLYFKKMSLGITAGMDLMIPLSALGAAVTTSVDDPANASKVDDPEGDLSTSLGFGANSLAMPLVFGAYYTF